MKNSLCAAFFHNLWFIIPFTSPTSFFILFWPNPRTYCLSYGSCPEQTTVPGSAKVSVACVLLGEAKLKMYALTTVYGLMAWRIRWNTKEVQRKRDMWTTVGVLKAGEESIQYCTDSRDKIEAICLREFPFTVLPCVLSRVSWMQ